MSLSPESFMAGLLLRSRSCVRRAVLEPAGLDPDAGHVAQQSWARCSQPGCSPFYSRDQSGPCLVQLGDSHEKLNLNCLTGSRVQSKMLAYVSCCYFKQILSSLKRWCCQYF